METCFESVYDSLWRPIGRGFVIAVYTKTFTPSPHDKYNIEKTSINPTINPTIKKDSNTSSIDKLEILLRLLIDVSIPIIFGLFFYSWAKIVFGYAVIVFAHAVDYNNAIFWGPPLIVLGYYLFASKLLQTRLLVLTSKRIISKQWWLGSINILNLDKIESITVLPSALNFGTIVIHVSGALKIKFPNIYNSNDFAKKILDAIDNRESVKIN